MWRRPTALLLLTVLLAGVAPGPSALASAPTLRGDGWRPGECRGDRGVTVAIDFRRLGKGQVVRCVDRRVGDGFTGRDALRAANISVRRVRDVAGYFVCRLQGAPGPRRDLDPGQGTYREDCRGNYPPTSAYWSSWYARDGGRWRYASTGAGGRDVVPGGFEGWSFHLGQGDARPPRHDPDRPGRRPSLADPTVTAAPRAAVTVGSARGAGRGADRPSGRAVGWLLGELRDGSLPGPFGGTDWGLSIDALWAMHAAGVGRAAAADVTSALAADVDAYIGPDTYGDPRARLAGATAKVLLAADVAGRDPARFGGYDLRAELLALMQGPRDDQPGRFSDRRTDLDASNTVGQSLGVVGLARTGGVPRPAVDFLADQQCAAGWFRLYADDGRTCAAGRSSAPDVDATATAVQALLAAGGERAAAGRALDWLQQRQRGDGSFGGGQSTSAPNANSTGLAAQALAAGGRDGSAAAAAGWLRARQLTAADVRGTPAASEVGAVGYDPQAVAQAVDDGLPRNVRDQWQRATAQAVLGLARRPLGTLGGRPLAPDPAGGSDDPPPAPGPDPEPDTGPDAQPSDPPTGPGPTGPGPDADPLAGGPAPSGSPRPVPDDEPAWSPRSVLRGVTVGPARELGRFLLGRLSADSHVDVVLALHQLGAAPSVLRAMAESALAPSAVRAAAGGAADRSGVDVDALARLTLLAAVTDDRARTSGLAADLAASLDADGWATAGRPAAQATAAVSTQTSAVLALRAAGWDVAATRAAAALVGARCDDGSFPARVTDNQCRHGDVEVTGAAVQALAAVTADGAGSGTDRHDDVVRAAAEVLVGTRAADGLWHRPAGPADVAASGVADAGLRALRVTDRAAATSLADRQRRDGGFGTRGGSDVDTSVRAASTLAGTSLLTMPGSPVRSGVRFEPSDVDGAAQPVAAPVAAPASTDGSAEASSATGWIWAGAGALLLAAAVLLARTRPRRSRS